ncbi:reverse transcriptase domain-containing protein [Tanacetum coccineum]
MHAFVDSKLVPNQVEGSYKAKGEKTKTYKEKALEIIRSFSDFQISHIPREENRKAGALSKLAAVQCEELTKGVLIEEFNELSVDMADVNAIIEEATRTWMTPIQEYIKKRILPEDATKKYTWDHAECMTDQKEQSIRLLMSDISGQPDPSKSEEWTLLGPSLKLQAESIPSTIITDNETQIINDPFKSLAEGLGIKLVSTLVYHPQANGSIERANRSIMQGIKTRLHQEGGAWVEELPNVLWAHRTTPKTSNRETPFSLAYGTEAVIPMEIGNPTRRVI